MVAICILALSTQRGKKLFTCENYQTKGSPLFYRLNKINHPSRYYIRIKMFANEFHSG